MKTVKVESFNTKKSVGKKMWEQHKVHRDDEGYATGKQISLLLKLMSEKGIQEIDMPIDRQELSNLISQIKEGNAHATLKPISPPDEEIDYEDWRYGTSGQIGHIE